MLGYRAVLWLVSVAVATAQSSSFSLTAFPLVGLSPSTAPINSIFDHAMDPAHPYATNGIVETFTGEIGMLILGVDSKVCYQMASKGTFTVNGKYTGSACGGKDYLAYDGHSGYDFAAHSSSVQAAADGVVIVADATAYQDNTGQGCACYGNHIVISHAGGAYQTWYGHLAYGSFGSSLLGATVTAGTQIATTDNTGDSTGEHLHFEVRKRVGGRYFPVDPYGWQGAGQDPYTIPNTVLWSASLPATGIVTATATLDGNAWASGPRAPINYTITDPNNNPVAGIAGLPFSSPEPAVGPYTLTYTSDGPPNATLVGVGPCAGPLVTVCTAQLAANQILKFNLQFVSSPPTAGLTMSSGTQSPASNGQTLIVSTSNGTTADVILDGSSSTFFNGNKITNWTWSANGSLIRSSHTSTKFTWPFPLGMNAISLVVSDNRGISSVAATGMVIVAQTGTSFVPSGSMQEARYYHTATLLTNGTVLVTGGSRTDAYGNTITTDTAEIYDPQTGTWRYTGVGQQTGMTTSRFAHTATRLADGRVLLAGGATIQANSGVGGYTAVPTTSAEIFDPATETFILTGALNVAHSGAQAALLNDGRVMVVGEAYTPIPSEIYNPSLGTWTAMVPAVPTGYGPAVAVVAGGDVFVAGGLLTCCAGGIPTVALYSPGTNTLRTMANLLASRAGQATTVLPTGQVLVIGGYDDSSTLSSTELYDTASVPDGNSQFGLPLNESRRDLTVTLLPNGDVLGLGGEQGPTSHQNVYLTSAELRNHFTGAWTLAGTTSPARIAHTATLLNDGTVLVAGGNPGVTTATAELWINAQ